MSTLPPEPSFDPNVPIVTPGGGTTAAYKDPNSPESIMKKTAMAQAQAKVDSRFDVKEGFQVHGRRCLLLPFIFLLILALFMKTRKETATIYIVALASILLLLYVVLSQNGRTTSHSRL